ncbi:DUF559 domain-containing protein [Rhodococcus spelaei]|uniref:DUF559 domain-containing protein n=1 Tax=Rhodococcus spelaei TaxID=2546320 RepID=A0A541B7Y0_9NOCA|nr:DUF559 domain-containing protein [Rhodococcus spelaei]TQF68431.1 DUF559 domain-containing protein [Rhodococcus spelaei]
MGRILVPFRASTAIEQGLVNRYQIRHQYTRIYPDTYLHRDIELDAVVRAQAVWCWSGGRGVLAGWSAAALWGTKWIAADTPGAIARAEHMYPPRGLTLYRDSLPASEFRLRGSYPVTDPARTAFDLGRKLPLDAAVEAVDAIYQATELTRAELTVFTAQHPGERGVVQLREVIALSDEGAESPWETKTRLAIVRAGLPRPDTQIAVHTKDGMFIGRVDMIWERWRVIVEYDGDHHFDSAQRNRDVERWNALEAAGWRVIRVKARQLTRGRATLMGQIRTVLHDAGARL